MAKWLRQSTKLPYLKRKQSPIKYTIWYPTYTVTLSSYINQHEEEAIFIVNNEHFQTVN